jgi:hypothetical protein
MAISDFDKMMINDTMVIYQGKSMKKSEADKLKRKEAKKKKIIDRNAKIIPTLPPYIKSFTKHLKLCKSLSAYYNNGYRQWGVIVRVVTENEFISIPFTHFVKDVCDMEKHLAVIEKIAKRNDRDIFGYIEKLHYAIDDARTHLQELSTGIQRSGILSNPAFNGKEFIYGNGRRLGIKELCSRTLTTLLIMRNTIDELKKICDNGIDIMEYDSTTKKTICFVTCG